MTKSTAQLAERIRKSIDVQAEIARLKTEKASAETAMARLQAARPALLTDMSELGDARLDAHDAEQAKAWRIVERRTAILVGLEAELGELLAAEKQATLRETYAAGEAAALEYKRLVETQYAPVAAKLAGTLTAMAEQLAIVDRANSHKPADMLPIDADGFRDIVPDRGPKPERTIEALYFVNARGIECSGNTPGAVMKYQTRDNPFYASWLQPREKIKAPSIVEAAKLPGADHDMLFGERRTNRW